MIFVPQIQDLRHVFDMYDSDHNLEKIMATYFYFFIYLNIFIFSFLISNSFF